MKAGRWFIFSAMALLVTRSTAAQTPGQTTPIGTQSLLASWVGWYYTPSTDFFLAALRVESNRAESLDRNGAIQIELWSAAPKDGGKMLRSRHLRVNADGTGFVAGSFAPILLKAGVQYFVGFENVKGLGVSAAGNWDVLPMGDAVLPTGSDAPPSPPEPPPAVDPPRSWPPVSDPAPSPTSTVPEPATMALLATGLFGLAGVSMVRRRRLA